MYDTLPAHDDDLLERCWEIEDRLAVRPENERAGGVQPDIRECLGVLMRQRYGPDPEIERFGQGMEGSRD